VRAIFRNSKSLICALVLTLLLVAKESGSNNEFAPKVLGSFVCLLAPAEILNRLPRAA